MIKKAKNRTLFFISIATSVILTILISVSIAAETDKIMSISIIGVGDINLGGTAWEFKKEKNLDVYNFFTRTKEIIRFADVAIGNLESPVTDRGIPHPDKTYLFRQPYSALKAIANAGFDIFCLANNHIMDYGKQGLFDTIDSIKRLGLEYSGAGKNLEEARKPAIYKKNGITVGYLAYSLTFPEEYWAENDKPGVVFGHERYVRQDVRELANKVDVVVVGFHWGGEARQYPKPYQEMLAHAAIEAGARIIFGHHPHVLEGIEWYKKGIIFYSLGNYVFGSYSKKSKIGAIAIVNIQPYGSIREVEIVPLDVFNTRVFFNPIPLKGEKLKESLNELTEISSPYNVGFRLKGNFIQVLPP